MRKQDTTEARVTPLFKGDEDALVDAIARHLYRMAGSEPVRVLEALALVLTRQMRQSEAPRGGDRPRDRVPPARGTREGGRPTAALGGSPDVLLRICRRIARRAAKGLIPDMTRGATHFHGGDELPGWAHGATPIAELGGFMFYRLPC